MKRFLLAVIIILLLLLGYLLKPSKQLAEKAFITGENLRIRELPSLESKVLGKLHKRDLVQVLSISKKQSLIGAKMYSWYKVRLNDISGWVSGKYIDSDSLVNNVPPLYEELLITTPGLTMEYQLLRRLNKQYQELSFSDEILKENNLVRRNSDRFTSKGFPLLSSANPINEVEQILGKPLNIETESVGNIHNARQLDTLNIFYFNGLKITIWQNQRKSRSFVASIDLNGTKYHPLFGINIGTNRKRVLKILGKPTAPGLINKSVLCYLDKKNGHNLRIYIENEQVARILWIPNFS